MARLRVSYRTLLKIWAFALCFGLGIEATHAATLDDWCREACIEECVDSGGCDVSWVNGCTCTFYCDDGTPGTAFCVD